MVPDTQVWIDWLVFDDPSTLALRAAAERGEIVIDAACQAELARVLAYPLGRRSLDEAARADLLVTPDRELLDLARHRRLPFRILAPAAV